MQRRAEQYRIIDDSAWRHRGRAGTFIGSLGLRARVTSADSDGHLGSEHQRRRQDTPDILDELVAEAEAQAAADWRAAILGPYAHLAPYIWLVILGMLCLPLIISLVCIVALYIVVNH